MKEERRQRMRNTEDQGEAENNGQKEKGFDEQSGVYRQRVWEAKSDVRWGERGTNPAVWVSYGPLRPKRSPSFSS